MKAQVTLRRVDRSVRTTRILIRLTSSSASLVSRRGIHIALGRNQISGKEGAVQYSGEDNPAGESSPRSSFVKNYKEAKK